MSSAFKRQFDCAGHCNALVSRHGNHVPVTFSAIARSELIAAFAGLTRIRIKVGAANSAMNRHTRQESRLAQSSQQEHSNANGVFQQHTDAECVMDWNRIEGNWKQFKGQAKEKWGRLTDDDLNVINGRQDQLEGKIQERYGLAKDQAKKDVETWFRSLP
jgi:uncharacterized protein YjbJ (UPF0337 family)